MLRTDIRHAFACRGCSSRLFRMVSWSVLVRCRSGTKKPGAYLGFDDSRQTPGRATPRRGVHIHTFQVPHGSGRRVFAAPFHVGPVNSQGQACSRTSPVIERGPFPEPGLVGLLANGPRGEHEKRRLQRTAFAKKQPPIIGSLPLYFYVNIYGYLIMQPSPPLLHLLRQGQACTQALSP